MKCVCGYEKLTDWEIERDSTSDDGAEAEIQRNSEKEDFIKIEGSFIRIKDYGEIDKVQIYSCPKCGTIKIAT